MGDLLNFLKDSGFQNHLQILNNNGIETLTALENCSSELESILPPMVARAICKKLSEGPKEDKSQSTNTDMVIYKKELELMIQKNNFEAEKKYIELEYKQKLLEKDFENKLLIKEKETDSIRREIEFKETEATLKSKIIEAEMNGKIKVLQVQLEESAKKPQISTSMPPFWNSTSMPPFWNSTLWGPWTGVFPFFPTDTVLLTATPYFGIIQAWLGTPRQWTLRFRATRNGFASSTFHSCCNNLGATITIVRSTNGYLFGGYNPNSWTSAGNYLSGGGSFIFTLTNPNGISPTAFHFKSHNGPYDISSHGPTFGGGHDIYISNNCNGNNSCYSNFPHSYNDTLGYGKNTFTGGYNFTVADYEVFTV